jgi:hypothetical protein
LVCRFDPRSPKEELSATAAVAITLLLIEIRVTADSRLYELRQDHHEPRWRSGGAN